MDILIVLLIPLLLFVVFPIYVLGRLAELGREVEELKRQVTRSPVVAMPTQRESPTVAPMTSELPVEPKSPVTVSPAYATLLRGETTTPPAHETETPSAAPAFGIALPDLESLIGANWLAKMGVVAIALAAAFFLQYAFRAGWAGPRSQVIAGLFTAAIMMGMGQYLLTKERYRAYAQVLASGGIVVYFLSIYAAYGYYQPRLIGYGPAFAALAIGALAASVLAIANNTEAVAVICILGAFAAPILIREGGGVTSAEGLLRLYAYLAVLNLWVVGLIRTRAWHSLAVVSFASTWLLFFAAGSLAHTGWRTEGYAMSFLLLSYYMGLRTLYAGTKTPSEEEETSLAFTEIAGLGLIVIGCFAFIAASASILVDACVFGLPDLTLAGMFVTLILAGMAIKLPPFAQHDREIRAFFGYLSAGVLGIVMMTAIGSATPTPHAQVPIAFAFALFHYLLFLATALIMHRRGDGERPALALVVANAFIHLLMNLHVLQNCSLWEVPTVALWMPLAATISLGSAMIAIRQRQESFLLPSALTLVAQALPLFGLFCALSVRDHGPAVGSWLFAGEFLLISSAWIAMRRSIGWGQLRMDLFAAFGNASVFFTLIAWSARTESFHSLIPLTGWAVAMAAYHAFVGGIVLRREEALHRLTYLGLAVTFLTIAIPLQLRASYITLAWAVEAAVLIRIGLTVGEKRARWYGLALLALAAAKAVLVDLTSRPASFHLLLNSRMLAGASVIVAAYVSAWWLWKARQTLSEEEKLLPTILSMAANLCTLLFTSMDLWDFVGLHRQSGGQANLQQLSLSLFWTVYALGGILVGIWQRSRPVRLFAMALLYLSIFKVFLFDLSWLGQPYRIVSFFTLGVTLLMVSLLYTRFEERLRGGTGPAIHQ